MLTSDTLFNPVLKSVIPVIVREHFRNSDQSSCNAVSLSCILEVQFAKSANEKQ